MYGTSISQYFSRYEGERQMSNAAERGGRLRLFVARSALSLALQALNGTPQSERGKQVRVATAALYTTLPYWRGTSGDMYHAMTLQS
ncbi:hypothetical protein J6590_024283 [Homalodisca vitripennis]|nr:hypothetical protein J6590_024283 [Homalodisca vitripennis]